MELCDINLWMVGDILLKADKMSMANSLEVRVPYVDTEVFAVARRIPACYRANASETKIALRRAAAEVLPPELTVRKKLGFPVPIREWLGMPEYAKRVREMFCSPWAKQFFDSAALERMLDKYLAGQANQWRNIWCVYSFLLWYEQFFILA
jgi:asparagine synthase (glutamine-hydrolysing)